MHIPTPQAPVGGTAPLLPPGTTVLERGWLSANNIVCVGEDAAAVVDTGYCAHAAQTVALVAAALGAGPWRSSPTPTCTATTAAGTRRCSRPGRRRAPWCRPGRPNTCATGIRRP